MVLKVSYRGQDLKRKKSLKINHNWIAIGPSKNIKKSTIGPPENLSTFDTPQIWDKIHD